VSVYVHKQYCTARHKTRTSSTLGIVED